eukprot:scaffold4232_cov215-Amphora_coffeaeformis.AAC.2
MDFLFVLYWVQKHETEQVLAFEQIQHIQEKNVKAKRKNRGKLAKKIAALKAVKMDAKFYKFNEGFAFMFTVLIERIVQFKKPVLF